MEKCHYKTQLSDQTTYNFETWNFLCTVAGNIKSEEKKLIIYKSINSWKFKASFFGSKNAFSQKFGFTLQD